jgi:tripartite-type tricarboxylate transporter receptor subunit TctC
VLPVVLPFMHDGRLHALAVANEKRSTLIPNVPTMGEAGWPAVLATAWNGVVVPAATPKNVIGVLNKEIARSLEAGDVKERFTAAGMEAIGGTPEEFGAFLRAESVKWAKVVRDADIKPE